jgi:ketosteroid isomerase-like protein
MRALGLGLLLVALMATAGSAQQPNEASLRAADAAQLAAARERDVNALAGMMHPAFTVNSPEGEVWPRERVLAMWRARGIGHDRFERLAESVTVVREVGVVKGREIVQPSADSVAGQRRADGGQSVQRRFTNVWIWEGDRWSFLTRHANEQPQKPN